MNTEHHRPRIYVADLAAYNAGLLRGIWVEADQDAEEIHAAIEAMLEASPIDGAEETALHDVDNFFGLRIDEFESIETVALLGAFVAEHQELGARIYEVASNLEEAEVLLEEDYQGTFDSLADWAEDLLDQTGQLKSLPEALQPYFDYEAYARDAELAGDVFTIALSHQVHVFWSR